MVPPGELMCRMTAAACDFSSRSSASTRERSLRISPSMLTRAIEPEDVSEARPPGVAITPTVTTAATAATAATTRQKVNLRRILRRSTITSESSDIEILLKYPARFASAALANRYPDTSIAMQYEENKAPGTPLLPHAKRKRAYRALSQQKGPGRNRSLIAWNKVSVTLTCRGS